MKTDDFDYELPQNYIAQSPADPRDSCKLMVLHRDGTIEHRVFSDIIDYLDPGDLLVANETRVFPARLLGHKQQSGGAAEVLLLDRVEADDERSGEQTWNCLVKPGKRLKPGTLVEFSATEDAEPLMCAEVLSIDEETGSRILRFSPTGTEDFDTVVHEIGLTPLPPYITDYTGDTELYQTVYAASEHSAAAPTAGLHFTEELLERIRDKGVGFATVDLEVGLDTFRTVSEDDPTEHVMHTERYSVPAETVEAIEASRAAGGRIVAVGTTTVRSLESAASGGTLTPCTRQTTDLYILPGYTFRVVDALITNFHVPRSTLLMLVSAFNSREKIMAAYEEAKQHGYRFFSFGDAMLLL